MSHPRTAGREIALQYLYMQDLLGGKDVHTFDEYLAELHPVPEHESQVFARELVASVLAHRAELDTEITSVAANWELKRMAVVDRNILRLGLAELLAYPETSHKIILNEAVELAKQYSSEEAGAFVNGLLDSLRLKLRPEPPVAPESPESPAPAA